MRSALHLSWKPAGSQDTDFSQFPDETEKGQSGFGGRVLLALQGLSVFPFNLYSGWTKVNENAYILAGRHLFKTSILAFESVLLWKFDSRWIAYLHHGQPFRH